MEREKRAFGYGLTLEQRADGKEYFSGRAVVFNEWSQLLGGWFRERIDPRAFDGADLSDVVAKFNHDPNFSLARTPDLALEVRADGLYYSFPYDAEDPDHVRVRRKIERGDVRGSSFEFTVAKGGAEWRVVEGDDYYEERTITKIDKLYDVAPVLNPAYLQTSAALSQLRAESDALKAERDEALKAERAESQQPTEEPNEIPVEGDDTEAPSTREYDLARIRLALI